MLQLPAAWPHSYNLGAGGRSQQGKKPIFTSDTQCCWCGFKEVHFIHRTDNTHNRQEVIVVTDGPIVQSPTTIPDTNLYTGGSKNSSHLISELARLILRLTYTFPTVFVYFKHRLTDNYKEVNCSGHKTIYLQGDCTLRMDCEKN